MIRKIAISICVLAFLSGCVPTKRLTYLQESEDTGSQYNLQRTNYKVQPNDILSITIRSYDLETSQLFNRNDVNQQSGLQAGDILFYLQGYSVGLDGNIELPVLGSISVLYKEISEIESLIEDGLSEYFDEEAVFVSVQLAGIRYSVVGEVNNPGKYVIYQNQANIFEALALAGDITTVGDRQRVMIVRQTNEGAKSFYLDLTDSKVINNPNYFIYPNDVINVQPLPQKSLGIGTTGFQTFTQALSVVASTITLIIAINSLNN